MADIAVDAAGNAYVTVFQGLVVAKYSPAGTLVWKKQTPSSTAGLGGGIALDPLGTLYLTGSFIDSANFDGSSVPGYGREDIFVTKLPLGPTTGPVYASLNGQFLARSPAEVSGAAEVELVTTYPNGAIYFTLDGSDPTLESRRYRGPFTITHDVVLRAVAYSADFSQSGELPPFIIVVKPAFDLTVETAGGGSFTFNPATGPYPSNTVVQVTAVSAPGWQFMGWLGDATNTTTTTSVTMTRDKRVVGVLAGR